LDPSSSAPEPFEFELELDTGASNKFSTKYPGWPDWANSYQLGDCFHWRLFFDNYINSPKFWATFFHFDKNMLGYNLGSFSQTLVTLKIPQFSNRGLPGLPDFS
jgi:hypothetical protein